MMRRLAPFVVLLLLLPRLALAEERILTMADGSAIKTFLFYPKNSGEGPWPLTILMSGGSANEYVVRAQLWLGYELATRGWAIAVPVSPDGNGFFGASGERIPEIIDIMQQTPEITEGKTLLVGVSNGGASAFEIASAHPERYYGVVAVPGIIKKDQTIGQFKGLPIYLRIGENDFLNWNRHLESVTDRLTEAGANVNAKLVAGGNHVFTIDWDELQPWLDDVRSHANTTTLPPLIPATDFPPASNRVPHRR